MVTQHGIPVEHQLGVRIDVFVVGIPQRVVDTGHPFEVVNVAGSGYKLDAYLAGRLAHLLGNGLLVVIAVPAHVVGYDKVEVVVD